MRYCIWLVWMAAAMAACCSCAGRKAQEQRRSDTREINDTSALVSELSSYWDGHDFDSLDGFDDIDAAEDKFERYIQLLDSVSVDEAVYSLTAFLDSAARDTVAYMVWASWFEPYLHSTVSPYRNDTLFVVWLDRTLADKVVDAHMLERLQQIRDVLDLNVVGKQATDVLLEDSDGVRFYISDLKGQRTLLMLLDANCPSCLDYLTENMNEYGCEDIRLIAVLVNGSPMHIEHISSRLTEDVMERWVLSWCPGQEIEAGLVYDLTMIPSRILLDSNNIIEKLYY